MGNFAVAGALLLLIAVAAANAPFLSERFLLVLSRAQGKGLGLRFLELLIWYGVVLGVALLLETRFGPRYPQGWEFYGITACLFVVLAYPGFVWRYLGNGRHRGAASRQDGGAGDE